MSRKSDRYIVDTIFPRGEIHLVGGPTGAGKTRWLFDTLLAWQRGERVLGYESFPTRWAYASCDRSEESVHRTLETMGIDPKDIPLISGMDRRLTITQVCDIAQREGAKLVVIEGFGGFVDNPLPSSVRHFFYSLRPFLNHPPTSKPTIIGVMESPKMKPKDKYENPRQRISGAATWGHYAETIILVEPLDPKIKDSPRRITVCPRNTHEILIDAAFKDGHLRPIVYDDYMPHIEITDAEGTW